MREVLKTAFRCSSGRLEFPNQLCCFGGLESAGKLYHGHEMFECIFKILWEEKIPRLLREIVRKISVLAFLNLSEICDEKM